MTSLRRGRCLFAALLALALLGASPAGASPETLKRSASNLLMSPLDVVCGPYVGVKSIFVNIRDIEDTRGVRIAYFVPGLAWNIGMQTFGAGFRALAGALELLPGIVLLPFETNMDPLYALPERQDGLVDIETPPLYIKFGINYVD
ncbi:MAG: hypothetical protein OEM05_06150 [Myxococcales bacterium]|nr:hypothetical protein [Myxococcales bacterium]